MTSDPLVHTLLSAGVQRVTAAPSDLEACARDFGGVTRAVPAVVVDALHERDVLAALAVAREQGVPITVRGGGHSFGGQSLCAEGIVVRNVLDATDQIRACREPCGTPSLEVSGRTTWRAVASVLARSDATVPVLTSELSTTVAGTLSAGGYGVRSIRYGAQVDHVLRLRLLLADGEVVTCSPSENEELFRCALGGYGQAGVIETAWLDLIPRPPKMTLRQISFDTPAGLMRHIGNLRLALDIEADHFFAQMTHEASFATYVRSAREGVPYDPPALSSPSDGRRHLWVDHAFPHPAACAFVDASVERLGDPFLRQHLERVYVLCLRRPRQAGGLFDIRDVVTEDPCVFGVGLYFTVHPDDTRGLRRVSDALRALCAEALTLGGRPYLQGSHGLDGATLDNLYPEARARLAALRTRHDPRHLLNRGALAPSPTTA